MIHFDSEARQLLYACDREKKVNKAEFLGLIARLIPSNDSNLLHHLSEVEMEVPFDAVIDMIHRADPKATCSYVVDTTKTGVFAEELRRLLSKESKIVSMLLENLSIDSKDEVLTALEEKIGRFNVAKQDAIFLCRRREEGEDDISHFLRMARFERGFHWSGKAEDKIFNRARQAGRECMKLAKRNQIMLSQGVPDRYSYIYSDLSNVYFFTAPLDAVNWLAMKKDEGIDALQDITLSNWAEVVAVNYHAEDIHSAFLDIYEKVREEVASKRIGSNPFPEKLMDSMMDEIQAWNVPEKMRQVFPRYEEARKYKRE